MRFRLLRMGIEGKVAVANLALIGCALLVVLASVHNRSEGWFAAGTVAYAVVAVLGFPAGWFAMLGETASGLSGPPMFVFMLGAIFLPLNAYLWGYVVAAIVRRCRKSHNACRSTADGRGVRTEATPGPDR